MPAFAHSHQGMRKGKHRLLTIINVIAEFTKLYENLDNSQTTYKSVDRNITKHPTQQTILSDWEVQRRQ